MQSIIGMSKLVRYIDPPEFLERRHLCYYTRHLRALHSFPTRRSSDLLQVHVRYRIDGAKRVADGKARAAPHPHAIHLARSEEHTSELQSQSNLVCRLLVEKT